MLKQVYSGGSEGGRRLSVCNCATGSALADVGGPGSWRLCGTIDQKRKMLRGHMELVLRRKIIVQVSKVDEAIVFTIRKFSTLRRLHLLTCRRRLLGLLGATDDRYISSVHITNLVIACSLASAWKQRRIA